MTIDENIYVREKKPMSSIDIFTRVPVGNVTIINRTDAEARWPMFLSLVKFFERPKSAENETLPIGAVLISRTMLSAPTCGHLELPVIWAVQ